MTDLVAITADLRIKALGLAKPIEALADPNAMHQQQAILILFIELFTILISAGIFHAINRYNSITTEVSYSDLFENPDDYQAVSATSRLTPAAPTTLLPPALAQTI